MIEALAWTLIHSLWEIALVGFVAFALLRSLRQSSVRYAAGLAAMGAMLILPLATFAILASGTPEGLESISPAAALLLMQLSAEATGASSPAEPWMPLLVMVWAGGVGLFSLRIAGGLTLVYIQTRRAVLTVPVELTEALSRLALRFGVLRSVTVKASIGGMTPTVVGWLKPVIVIPANVLRLPLEQLEALLAHELAHIRRHDFAINLAQHLVEALFFYHPAVWWLGRQIREERENCCDDLVVAVCGDRVTYARALASLEGLRAELPAMAVAANGGSLMRRLRRLLGQPYTRESSPLWLLAAIIVCSAAIMTATLLKAEPIEAEETPVAAQARPAPLPAPIVEAAPPAQPAAPSPASSPQAPQPVQRQVVPATPGQSDRTPVRTFIEDLAASGYSDLSVDDLIAFRIHGVTGQYIRDLRAAGFNPDKDELVAMRIHNVTPDYARRMREDGFGDLTIEQLVATRIHNVSPDDIRQLRALGLDGLSFDNIVAAKIHGLNPEFVRDLQSAGFTSLTFDQVIAARIHGFNAQSARGLRDAGFANLTFDDLVAAQIHGVTPEFVRRAQELGLKDLTFDKIVQLKIHGILD